MDPVTAAILIGAATTAISAYSAKQQFDAAVSSQEQQKKKNVQNQNALVEQGFNNRTQGKARGFGSTGASASSVGGVLNGIGEGNQASILG